MANIMTTATRTNIFRNCMKNNRLFWNSCCQQPHHWE